MTSRTNDAGMVTNVYQYTPFGQVTLGSAAYEGFFAYGGESYNPNTGLEYLRARYYDTGNGNFLTEDTYLGNLTDPLTQNRYSYVKNNPVNYVDPSGHRLQTPVQRASTSKKGSVKTSNKSIAVKKDKATTTLKKSMSSPKPTVKKVPTTISNRKATASKSVSAVKEAPQPEPRPSKAKTVFTYQHTVEKLNHITKHTCEEIRPSIGSRVLGAGESVLNWLGENAGAVIGTGSGVAATTLLFPAGAPAWVLIAGSSMLAGMGAITGGTIQKEVQKARLEEQFKVPLTEQEFRKLADTYNRYNREESSYWQQGMTLMLGGSILYGCGVFATAVGWISYPGTNQPADFDMYHKSMYQYNKKDLIDGQLDVESSVWDLGRFSRGDIIDNAKGLENNLGHNFPTVDRLVNRVLESTKSYDVLCPTYANASQWLTRMKADIWKLACFMHRVWNKVPVYKEMYDSKQINIVIPNVNLSPDQWAALRQAIEYAEELGIAVRVYTTK